MKKVRQICFIFICQLLVEHLLLASDLLILILVLCMSFRNPNAAVRRYHRQVPRGYPSGHFAQFLSCILGPARKRWVKHGSRHGETRFGNVGISLVLSARELVGPLLHGGEVVLACIDTISANNSLPSSITGKIFGC